MYHNTSLALCSVAALTLAAAGARGQAPAAAIDPAQARLEQTLPGLDAPGSTLAYSPELTLLAAGLFIFLCIWLNADNLFQIIAEKYEKC